MFRRIIITSTLIALLSTAAAAEVYLWPLHGKRRITSSFSEYRDGHYHAGIDLRSFGAVGLPCLAVYDGYVSRIRIGPSGYGKALYLRLSDGRTAVYAHLSSFTAALDSIAWNYRAGKGASWCDMNLPSGAYSYSTGDTVCYSGMSGATAPHLHFELRDDRERPINPLDGIFSVPDAEAPIISGLQVIPEKGGIIDGGRFEKFYLLRAGADGVYILPDTLQMQGEFRFGVSVWDEQGYGRYAMAPLEVTILIDDDPLYTIRNSSFSYAQADEVDLEYQITGKGAAGRYLQMYRKEGDSRTDRRGAGMIGPRGMSGEGISLEKGLHSGEIICRDASGNTSRAHFDFFLHKFPVITEARRLEAASEIVIAGKDPDGGPVERRCYESSDGGSTWTPRPVENFGLFGKAEVSGAADALYRVSVTDDEGAEAVKVFGNAPARPESDRLFFEIGVKAVEEGVRIDISPDAALEAPPSLRILHPSGPDTIQVFPSGKKDFAAVAAPDELEDGWNVLRVSGNDYRGYRGSAAKGIDIFPMQSGRSADLEFSDTLSGVLESPSVISVMPCIYSAVSSPGPVPPGTAAESKPFSLDFLRERLRRPMKLVSHPGTRTGLFRWDDNGGWKCVGVPAMEDGSVRIDRPGTYMFIRDGLPPHIRHAAVEKAPPGSGFFKPYIIRVPVEEDGSGIDAWSAEAYLDGRRFVCEWDEFRNRLDIPVPASTSAGPVKLRVEISDRCGNRAVEEFSFVIE